VRYPELFPQDARSGVSALNHVMFTDGLGAREAETILERLAESSATMATCEVRVLGGAMAGVPIDATAFAHRQRRIMLNVAALHEPADPRSEHAAWVRRLAAELAGGAAGAYVGLLGDEGEARVRAAYPGATWDRLSAVKAAYDPDNLFRLNQNVTPEAGR
jgi:FAD/FMN-containing dehydrogenase